MTTYQIIYAWGDYGPDSVTGKWSAHTFMDGHAEPYVPLAAVAAAYEVAAECALGDKTKLEEARVKSHLTYLVMQRDNIALSIRSFTPADATAALETMLKRARNEALEGFADFAPDLGAKTREPTLREILVIYYSETFSHTEARELADQYIAAIRAMKEDV